MDRRRVYYSYKVLYYSSFPSLVDTYVDVIWYSFFPCMLGSAIPRILFCLGYSDDPASFSLDTNDAFLVTL